MGNEVRRRNGLGLAGFILSLVALFCWWSVYVDGVIWFLGFLFSFIGVFKKPRAFAIAGLCISLIGFVLLLLIFGAAVAFLSSL